MSAGLLARALATLARRRSWSRVPSDRTTSGRDPDATDLSRRRRSERGASLADLPWWKVFSDPVLQG
jgi:hypothetical protein